MILKIILKLLSSELTKQLIGLAIKKLLDHKEDGITKDVIKVVIDGAVASKQNPLKNEDVFHIRSILGI